MESLPNFAARLKGFLENDIWRVRLQGLPPLKGAGIRLLRTFSLALNGFARDRCAQRASALTFYTLLSIVPVAAMAFGIAKGFGFEKMLETELYSRFAGQEEIVSRVIEFAQSLLENTRGGLLAGIGLALLFWSVVKVLGQIEAAMNATWGVAKQRSLGRKFSDYLSIMLISPLLVILSSSATVYITTQVTEITESVALLDRFSQVIFFSLRLLPYGLVWILFTVLYILMPNTKVRVGPGIFAGIIAGTLFQLVQWGYIAFQIGAARYNAIYGSFAALPLFLVWLQLSWMIVLLGSEISFAAQNAATYEFEPDAQRISPAYRRLITLEICRVVVKRFAAGQKPLTAMQIAEHIGLPIKLVTRVLDDLVTARIISVTGGEENGTPAYQPARDIHTLTISSVVEALDHQGIDKLPLSNAGRLETLANAVRQFNACAAQSPGNRLLKDI